MALTNSEFAVESLGPLKSYTEKTKGTFGGPEGAIWGFGSPTWARLITEQLLLLRSQNGSFSSISVLYLWRPLPELDSRGKLLQQK